MKNDPKTVGTLLAAVLTFGCGGTAAAPVAGSSEGFIPDLRGRQVMVFPVQIRTGVAGDASPEIVFALRARGTEIDWIFPDELEALLARAPAVDSAVRGLPVGIFLSAEVERIGHRLDSGSRSRWSGGCGWGVGRRDRRDHRERPERPGDLVRDRRRQAGLGGRLRVGGFGGGVAGRNVVVVRTVERDTD